MLLHSLLVFVVSEEKPIVIQIDIALYAISWDSLANLLFDFHFKQFYYGVSMHCSLALSCLEFGVHLEIVNLYISPNLRSFGAISFSSSFFFLPHYHSSSSNSDDLCVKPFDIIPQAPEALFIL